VATNHQTLINGTKGEGVLVEATPRHGTKKDVIAMPGRERDDEIESDQNHPKDKEALVDDTLV
jgi:hypothetical protein